MFDRRWIPGSLLLSVMVFLALMGCRQETSETTSDDQPTVYLIVKATESEFWQIVMKGAQHKAQELGIHLIVQAPVTEADLTKQIAIFENAVAAQPDAIVVAPTVSDSLVPALENAAAQQLPVIVIDSAVNTEEYVSFLASDNVEIGRIAAHKMAEALTARHGKPQGKIVCVHFMSGVGSLEERKKGFLEILASDYPGIEIIDRQDAQGKQGTSLNIVQNFLTAHPDLDGIFASNQNTGDETVRALDMQGKKDLAVVVVDAGPQEVWGLENGYVHAVVVQKPWSMGAMGVEYALRAIRGDKLEKFIDTGVTGITLDMVTSGAAEEFLDPLAFYGQK